MQLLMKWAGVVACAGLAAGCAGTGAKLPEYKSLPIAVSSGWGTGFEGDYEVPNSQVSIGGRANTTGMGAAGFGLIGLAVATAVDQYRNASDLKGAADALRVKFDALVAEEIRKRSGDGVPDYRIVARADPETQMLLFPFARFLSGGEEKPHLLVYIEARFGERTKTSFSEIREFIYVTADSRRIVGEGGWADQDGTAFKAHTRTAFERIVEALSSDVRGKYKRDDASLPRVRWRVPYATGAMSAVVLAEHPAYLVVAPVRESGVLNRAVYLVDRGLVEPSQQ